MDVQDNIRPGHYDGDNCMEIIEAVTKNYKGAEAFCIGNIVKYLYRASRKNGMEDIKKAEWYMGRLVLIMEQDS